MYMGNNVVEKLLNNEISLESLSLEEFDANRKIYNSRKEARCKGFEAEHIVSVKYQMIQYNLEHKTNYQDRYIFEREVGIPDDRCYRLTVLEHIIRHYLKSKQNEVEKIIFLRMISWNFNKLNDLDKLSLNNLIDLSKLRESIPLIQSNSMTGRHHFTNGEDEIFTYGDCPSGWWIGQRKREPGCQSGSKNPNFGKIWCNNGEKNLLVPIDNPIPTGYIKGRIKSDGDKIRGRHYYNNGIEEKMLYECPDGWVLGRVESSKNNMKVPKLKKDNLGWNKGRHFFNNGIKEVLSETCPEGYVKGRLKKGEIK